MKLFVIGCVATIAAFGSSPVLARDASVAYLDLNLSRPQDLAKLERRIDSAAREVCEASPRAGSLLRSPESVRCYRDAMIQARAQVAAAQEAEAAAKLAVRSK